MAEAYFKHAKRGRFEDEEDTEKDTGADSIILLQTLQNVRC